MPRSLMLLASPSPRCCVEDIQTCADDIYFFAFVFVLFLIEFMLCTGKVLSVYD